MQFRVGSADVKLKCPDRIDNTSRDAVSVAVVVELGVLGVLGVLERQTLSQV